MQVPSPEPIVAPASRLPAGALDGVRVLDITTVVMGPFATQILGDLGADVIKLEPPAGDTTRQITPMRSPGMGYMFLNLNRNKRSLVLDLKQDAAREALLKLAPTLDVIVSNVRPKALARLGVSYESLSAVNPRLIFVSLVGFGQDGPYADHPVYEDLIQALTAIPSMLVAAGAERPQYVPLAFNDRGVGLHAAVSIIAALFWRERSGRGQTLEISMFEAMAQSTLSEHMGGLTFEPPIGPPGYKRTLTKHRRPVATADGYVAVIVYTDKHWRSFLRLVGQEDRWNSDPRIKDIGARTKHADELYEFIADSMRGGTTDEWLAKLHAADIPAEPLHTLDSLVADPHLAQTGFLAVASHPTEGRIRQVAPIGKWSGSPPLIRRHAPRLGEHSVEVLREAGLSAAAIQQLLDARATMQPC